jgi:cyclase|tara:strand:+ start:294 stop:1130 length:837 start_codon:yes stop_codon:yes gene_type:complete
LIKRIIARLDIKNNFLVKGMHLEGLRILGYPELFAKKYFDENIDEIVFQDIVASLYKRNQLSSLTNKITKNIFTPITVGGGIRNINDIKEILINGADRVSINTAAVNDKKFINDSVRVFGSSTITITVETLKIGEKYKVYTDSGRTDTNLDTFEWIKEIQDMGVGEIILTSINNEGTGKGFDLNLYEKASKLCKIPLLAHGGTRDSEDVYKLFVNTDIDGAVIASAFHFNYYKELLNKKEISLQGSTNFLINQSSKNMFFLGIDKLKKYLKSKNINIR